MGEAEPLRFSVVVPAYNAAQTLAETLDAILAQERADWECVVVDDGSTDQTLRVAGAFERRDARFRVIHQVNAGTAGAYNTAVRASRGPLIVMCSADDILFPEHLAHMSAFIDTNPGYDIYSTNGYYWRPDGRDLVYYDPRSREAHSKSLADVIRRCFHGVGAAYRRELFDLVNGYRAGVFGEDYDFWLRAMALGARHRYLPEPLSLFRISAQQKSSDLERMYRSDIQLVTELRANYALSAEELKAVDDCILERERLIRELHGGALRGFRTRFEPIGVRIVGRPLARRSWHALRAIARATARR